MSAVPRENALLEEFGSRDARARDESWRYSKPALRALAQQEFIAADIRATLSAELRERFEWEHTQGRRAAFVNGGFSTAYSDLSAIGNAIAIRHEQPNRCVLTISADLAEPLHLVYLSLPSPLPSRWQASSEVQSQAGKAHLIEHHLGATGADVLGVLTSTAKVSTGAELQITTLCDLPDSVSLYRRTQATAENAATLRTTHALLGGSLQRHDLDIDLAGTHARYESRGAFVLRGRQHVDTHLDVRHVARDTACDIVWRGVADQRARGVFHGAITVAEGADGADAKLSNKNLLLSAQAEIDTQPVLEIYADEVKAAHGATVGQLDERALFYLRSRGIPVSEARRLLVAAFCDAALDGVAQSWLREHIARLLAPRLAGASA